MEGRGERKTREQNSPNLETRGPEGDGWLVDGGEEGSLVLGDVEGEGTHHPPQVHQAPPHSLSVQGAATPKNIKINYNEIQL